jgi:ribose transport system ATP-binding protein
LQARGLAVLYISHFLEEVRALCDRFTVLRDGRSVGSGDVATTSDAQIVAMMVGREVAERYPRSPRTPGDVVLEVGGGATLTLRRGEVLGIAGLVGAGRTELLRAIFGLDPVRSGRVVVKSNADPASPARRWSQGVGFVSEDRKTEGLALSQSIADNITLSSLRATVRPSARAAASRRWIEQLGIRSRDAAQPVRDLSGGNQQKVALARLLEHGVDVLLLDEPTRGIDVGAKAEIYRRIDELACAGRAVLIVSSYLPELLGICDRIAVMCRGQVGPARPVSEWDEHEIMMEATTA